MDPVKLQQLTTLYIIISFKVLAEIGCNLQKLSNKHHFNTELQKLMW